MCLSRVYYNEKKEELLIMEEVSQVFENNGIIKINTIFEKGKELRGYSIKEVNLIENYIILKKNEEK